MPADLGFFFTSLVAHPPIVLCVLLVRLLVSTGAKALHKVLDLPDVKNPQEGDLGFLANMALSSRPVLKEFLVKGRKSLDDVFVFIFALVVFVAIRAIWIS
ncbi:Transmembrane protein [Phytophthora megakarya]|uniref:Transmembrane protein n=1 Tax=Phytophthora megakarya TaxID=4795 RepID=A0A225UE18_9STRA|nr:Transmembrane protein [Phytophthora megakarya]